MANDYAAMVRSEFGGPMDVVGLSTGGSIAQVFAADHPDLVRRLVLYSSAYKLNDEGRQFQRRLAELAAKLRWSAVLAEGFAFMFLPRQGLARLMTRPLVWLIGLASGLLSRPPASPSDYTVTIEAEDRFDFRSRLREIKAPTLVIGGARDPYYSPRLFRETAAGIPNGRLILYDRAGQGFSSSAGGDTEAYGVGSRQGRIFAGTPSERKEDTPADVHAWRLYRAAWPGAFAVLRTELEALPASTGNGMARRLVGILNATWR